MSVVVKGLSIMNKQNPKPKWTVVYNIVSPENPKWIGTGWEFFDKEDDAIKCFNRHEELGNIPTKRHYFAGVPDGQRFDFRHLGAHHQMEKPYEKEMEKECDRFINDTKQNNINTSQINWPSDNKKDS